LLQHVAFLTATAVATVLPGAEFRTKPVAPYYEPSALNEMINTEKHWAGEMQND
jgi:hypothetical protein